MLDPDDSRINELVAAIRKSNKYQAITPDLIQHIGMQELARHSNFKQAIKATRTRLHQIGGAFLNAKINYTKWLNIFSATPNMQDPIFIQNTCDMMRLHTSTHERLPILEKFFTTTLQSIAPIHSVMDLACGLNPLAIPWMPLAKNFTYYACDIFEDMLIFLNDFFKLTQVDGLAFACDLSQSLPAQPVQLAYLLKTLPCLEQLDSQIGFNLIENILADHILISYPVKSLGGREKGMLETYKQRFAELTQGRGWQIQTFEFSTELAFLLSRLKQT